MAEISEAIAMIKKAEADAEQLILDSEVKAKAMIEESKVNAAEIIKKSRRITQEKKKKRKKDKYVETYNKEYLDYYVSMNKINDKQKADLISKVYVYGYVENAPYQKTFVSTLYIKKHTKST